MKTLSENNDIKSVMEKIYRENIKNFHSDDNDELKSVWQKIFPDDKDYRQVIYEIIKSFYSKEDFRYRLPYKTENAIYHLSFIANEFVMKDENNSLYDFLNLKAIDFINYIKENIWEQIKYYNMTDIESKNTTIGELIMKANKDLKRGNIYQYNKAKATIVIILIYSFGFVFETKGVKKKV